MSTAVSLDPAFNADGTLKDPTILPTRNWTPNWIPTGGSDSPVKFPGFYDTSYYLVVNSNCKDPEAVIKWLNATNQYWYDLNDPVAGGFSEVIHHDDTMKLADGSWNTAWTNMMGPYLSDPNGGINGVMNTYYPSMTKWFVDYNPPTGLTSLDDPNWKANASYIDTATVGWLAGWVIDHNATLWAANATYGLPSAFIMLANEQANSAAHMQQNVFMSAPTEDMNTLIPTLAALQMTEYTNIIMGQVPLSDFDNFVTQWKAAGGDQLTQDVNTWLQGQNG